MKHLIWLVIWVLAVVAIIFFVWTRWHEVKTVVMPIENKVEKAVQMRNLENHFVQWRHMFFGGAGAGGQGAAVIWADTADRFLNEVKVGEKIYTVFQRSDDDRSGLTGEKIYIAGIENRAMLLGYKDVYGMPPHKDGLSWVILSYSPEEVIFRGDNRENMILLSFAIVLIGVVIGGIGHMLIYDK